MTLDIIMVVLCWTLSFLLDAYFDYMEDKECREE